MSLTAKATKLLLEQNKGKLFCRAGLVVCDEFSDSLCFPRYPDLLGLGAVCGRDSGPRFHDVDLCVYGDGYGVSWGGT